MCNVLECLSRKMRKRVDLGIVPLAAIRAVRAGQRRAAVEAERRAICVRVQAGKAQAT